MSEKLINFYQIILQTLLTVLITVAVFNARSICKEQIYIKAELDQLKLNQVKILTILKTEPVALESSENAWFDLPIGYQTNQ